MSEAKIPEQTNRGLTIQERTNLEPMSLEQISLEQMFPVQINQAPETTETAISHLAILLVLIRTGEHLQIMLNLFRPEMIPTVSHMQ